MSRGRRAGRASGRGASELVFFFLFSASSFAYVVFRSQCAKRNLICTYPTISRRGQHKRGPRGPRVSTVAASPPKPPHPHPPSQPAVPLTKPEVPEVKPEPVPISIPIPPPAPVPATRPAPEDPVQEQREAKRAKVAKPAKKRPAEVWDPRVAAARRAVHRERAKQVQLELVRVKVGTELQGSEGGEVKTE